MGGDGARRLPGRPGHAAQENAPARDQSDRADGAPERPHALVVPRPKTLPADDHDRPPDGFKTPNRPKRPRKPRRKEADRKRRRTERSSLCEPGPAREKA